MQKRWWRILIPGVVVAGLIGATVPIALAAEENDPNNRLKVSMTLRCSHDGKSVMLTWNSLWPDVAKSMTAKWYDATIDSDLHALTPASQAAQVAAVTRNGDKARGRFTIRNRNGHKIVLFVDALSGPAGTGGQVFGIGRKLATIHC